MLGHKIVAGACSGIAFWFYALPVDTVKTRIEADKEFMTSKENIRLWEKIVSTVKKQGGILSLYRALPVALLRGIPGAIITLSAYDVLFDILSGKTSLH